MMVLAAINFRRRKTLHCKALENVNVERAIGPEPRDVLKAIVEFAASPPGEEDAATARLRTALAPVLEGSPKERERVAAELAKTINERLKSSGG